MYVSRWILRHRDALPQLSLTVLPFISIMSDTTSSMPSDFIDSLEWSAVPDRQEKIALSEKNQLKHVTFLCPDDLHFRIKQASLTLRSSITDVLLAFIITFVNNPSISDSLDWEAVPDRKAKQALSDKNKLSSVTILCPENLHHNFKRTVVDLRGPTMTDTFLAFEFALVRAVESRQQQDVL